MTLTQIRHKSDTKVVLVLRCGKLEVYEEGLETDECA